MNAAAVLAATTDLDDVLDDLAGLTWIPGINTILTGIRETQDAINEGHLTLDATQTLLAGTAGSAGADLVTALAHLVTTATNPDTNPTLRRLPLDQQKETQHHGEIALYNLTDTDLHQPASEASAAISSH
ncbi:hypothetical protein ABZ802_31455 [Streptomyces sp. NPDC047737]|uniref:hypothetical protein n=1 Tax=Streptomyces sp. NPDC047737 TaxID=3155740 RepID=UPI0033CC232D